MEVNPLHQVAWKLVVWKNSNIIRPKTYQNPIYKLKELKRMNQILPRQRRNQTERIVMGNSRCNKRCKNRSRHHQTQQLPKSPQTQCQERTPQNQLTRRSHKRKTKRRKKILIRRKKKNRRLTVKHLLLSQKAAFLMRKIPKRKYKNKHHKKLKKLRAVTWKMTTRL